MVLLLSGSTDLTRGVVVDAFLAGHPDWRHLALEDLQVEKNDSASSFLCALLVACECAREVLKEGLQVVITCPRADMLPTVQQAFPDDLVSVLLGRHPRATEGYDRVIDTSRQSVDETCRILQTLLS